MRKRIYVTRYRISWALDDGRRFPGSDGPYLRDAPDRPSNFSEARVLGASAPEAYFPAPRLRDSRQPTDIPNALTDAPTDAPEDWLASDFPPDLASLFPIASQRKANQPRDRVGRFGIDSRAPAIASIYLHTLIL
jgi:hypothetical protein